VKLKGVYGHPLPYALGHPLPYALGHGSPVEASIEENRLKDVEANRGYCTNAKRFEIIDGGWE
jgi:hypothetical protein